VWPSFYLLYERLFVKNRIGLPIFKKIGQTVLLPYDVTDCRAGVGFTADGDQERKFT
jgi:hypothetical protein